LEIRNVIPYPGVPCLFEKSIPLEDPSLPWCA
jgi:hypothetical protein